MKGKGVNYEVGIAYEDKNGTTYPDVPWEPKEAFYRIAEYYSK